MCSERDLLDGFLLQCWLKELLALLPADMPAYMTLSPKQLNSSPAALDQTK